MKKPIEISDLWKLIVLPHFPQNLRYADAKKGKLASNFSQLASCMWMATTPKVGVTSKFS